MEYEISIPFKNFTEEAFTGRFGGVDYTFEPGAVYSVPEGQALHFAKHLAIRELHKKGTPQAEMLAEVDMKALMDKCFPQARPNERGKTGGFARLDTVKEDEAKEATGKPDDNVLSNTQEDEEEDNTVTDDKNNAGTPKFKDEAYK